MTRKLLLTVAIGLLVAYLFFRKTFDSVVAGVKSIGTKTVAHPAVNTNPPPRPSQTDNLVNAAINVGQNAANQLIDKLFNSDSSVSFDPFGNASADPSNSTVDVSTLI